MLEISWSEVLILAVVTLLFVGPKELPVFLRTIGRYAGVLRRQANEFKAHFDTAMREAEFAQMKEEMDKMQASVNAEVMGAEKAMKDAGQAASISPGSHAQAASFTAAATAAVFPQTSAYQAQSPVPAAAMGQVYVKPQPELLPASGPVEAPEDPQPLTAEFSTEPPRPQVVTLKTAPGADASKAEQ